MHPLLFYSESCPFSIRVINALKNTADADKALRLVCVDGQLDKIPAEIQKVPALVVPTSRGNQVVYESDMYEWLNSILRMDKKREAPQGADAGPGHDDMTHQPVEFMPAADAFLCDVVGDADSASHLFAGAGVEIRLTTEESQQSGRRHPISNDAMDRFIESRNKEISSLYSAVPRPV